MTEPLDMRLDHAMTSPVFRTPQVMFACDQAHLRMGDVPDPYRRMRFDRRISWERQPKPKQLAHEMLGPAARSSWGQTIAPFKRHDRSGYVHTSWLGMEAYSPAQSVKQPTLFEVYAAASRGTFILTWQFAVRSQP